MIFKNYLCMLFILKPFYFLDYIQGDRSKFCRVNILKFWSNFGNTCRSDGSGDRHQGDDVGKKGDAQQQNLLLGYWTGKKNNLCKFNLNRESGKLDFKTAVEFCAVRKMEIIAFDTSIEMDDIRFLNYQDYLRKELFIPEKETRTYC